MTKNKIYLSLDDLYKLYGITPAILDRIIKEKKKRKTNKKKKINNKNMENNKSSSNHMNISTNLLATETQRLNATNIQKHIDDINKNNKLLLENNKETKENNNDSEIKNIIDGIKSGKFQVKKLSNGIQIKNPELNKKSGPKPKSERVEFLGEKQTKTKVNNPLTNVKTSLMGNKTNVIAVDFDDTYGNIPFGLSSDNFMNTSDETEIENNNNNEDMPLENSKVEEIDNPQIENVVKIPLEEQKAGIIETVKTYKDYNKSELKALLKANNIKAPLKSKQSYYDTLQENNII